MPPVKRRRVNDATANGATSPRQALPSENASDSTTMKTEPGHAVAADTLAKLAREHEAILKQLDGPFAFIKAMLLEFWDELRKPPTQSEHLVVKDDGAWFWFVEMRFLIVFLYEMTFMEFSLSVTKPDSLSVRSGAVPQERKEIKAHRAELQERIAFLARLKKYVATLSQVRRQATAAAGLRAPRVFRLATMYKLTEQETDLFQLLVVFQGCQSNAVRCQLIEEDAQRRMSLCQRLAGISEIDVAEFYDDQREHVKEGTVMVDEENYATSLSLSNICVRVLLGRQLTSSQELKLSQTALEDLLHDEGFQFADVLDTKASHHPHDRHAKREAAAGYHLSADDDDRSDHLTDPSDTEDTGHEHHNGDDESERDDVDEGESSAFSFIGGYKPKKAIRTRRVELDEATAHLPGIDQSELKPYNPDNQLEYLEDRFQVVAYAIRASGARVKDQMKEAGTKQPWESTTANAGRRELKAKQRVYDRRTVHRLNLTQKAGRALPRLEEISAKFKLTKFEQNVIVMLIGKTISPVIKNLIDGVDTSPVQRMDESIIINQILSVFCDTFQEQVAHRVFFYKSSRLLSRGLVKLHRGRWHSTAGDLVDQRVELDRRVLDWVVGLDTEINELVEGSDLYAPKVQLDQVVLPEEHKATILQTVESYEAFRKYRKKSGLEDTLSYGTGLVLLLCGASGTGKTMTVNAVAHHLKKRVLLVDFPSLQGKRQEGVEVDADLRGLFREADMSNAVLFFDECETIFRQRDHGCDRLLNALLTEIERYEGIVFLATNRPFDLDEAMHRRITAVFEFKAPDHLQRKQIWQVLMQSALTVADDVDWDAIALKYELSGGFIKNAILSSLLQAISRDAEHPVITHADIVSGCALQMRGSLHMKTFDHRVVPTTGLDALIAEDGVKTTLQQVVHFEKARSVIYGQWGFDFGEAKSKQKGVSVLLCGPPGVGKVAAAKAIGFEVGRPLKLVHVAQLQAETLAETRRAVRAVFDDARLMDAVVVLEGFEAFGSMVEGSSSSSMMDAMDSPRVRLEVQRLLETMDSFPGITVLVATVASAQVASLKHSEFAGRVKFVVEMRTPHARLREKIWRACFPPTAPVEASVDFKKLGERCELSHTAISDAVFRAAASAALRDDKRRVITMQDLVDAAEVERRKARAGGGAMDNLFM